MQNARMLGIKHLYHYQNANLKWLEPTVLQNTVHCPSPGDFNDPWDCKPCFTESVADDPAEREQLVQFMENADRKCYPGKPEEERRHISQRLRTDVEFLKSNIRQLSNIGDLLAKQFRVYCLSTQPDLILMWGHYAAKHTGLCLEFSTDNEVFADALKVEYCDDYPRLQYGDSALATALMPMLTKSAEWQHENEFRLISEEKSRALSATSLHSENHVLSIPGTALKSIILGNLAPTDFCNQVHELVAGHNIVLKQAIRIRDRFALTIEPYSSKKRSALVSRET